jgi:hypothetical protein
VIETGGSLADLSDKQFRAWAPKGIGELRQLMLFRWDPDQLSTDFPVSEDHYEGIARTVVLGLRMGDDRARFERRLDHQQETPGWVRADPSVLDRLWHLTNDWLPRSLAHWWPAHIESTERALPFHFDLLGYDDAAQQMTRAEWLEASVKVAESMASEAGAANMRTDDEFVAARSIQEVLLALRRSLAGDAEAGYRWSTPEVDFVLRVCQDDDLHVSSERPLPRSAGLSVTKALLRT